VLCGMGFETHERAGLRKSRDAKKAQQLFSGVVGKAEQVVRMLPGNRELLAAIKDKGPVPM